MAREGVSHISSRALLILACLVLLVFQSACSSEEAETPRGADTPTEGAREVLDARAESMLLEGQRAYEEGNLTRALALLDSAEIYAPNAPVISYNRGRVYTGMNQFEAAREAFQTAVDLDPNYPEAHFRLGNLASQRGELRKALNLYRTEERIAPSSALYVEKGLTYGKLGQPDSARIAYEKAISLDSTNANAHMMYGQFLEETGALEPALAHSRRALSLEPDRPNYQFAVGSQLFQLGRLEEAADYLKRAADARLLHYPAQYNLGQVLLRLGREAEANRYLARADSARSLMDQITAAQGAASRNPQAVDAWTRLGVLFRRAGERDNAVQAFNRALEIEPRNLRVHNKVGEMMLAEGKTEEAIKRFQAILSADESMVDAWLNLGLAFATAGNCENARLSWQRALDHRPGNATATKYLEGLCRYTAQ